MSHLDDPIGSIDIPFPHSPILHWDSVQEFQIPLTLPEAKALEHAIIGDGSHPEFFRKQTTSLLRQRQLHRHKLVLMMITYLEHFQTFDQTSFLLLSEAIQLDAFSASLNDFTKTAQKVFDMVSPQIREQLERSLLARIRLCTKKDSAAS